MPAGTPVTLRFRTFHDDVTGVKARLYSVDTRTASRSSTMHKRRQRRRLLPGRPRRQVVRLLADDDARQLGRGQPLVPVHRHRRHRHRLLRRRHRRPRRRPRLARPTTRSTAAGRSCSTCPASRRPAWAKDAVIYQIFPDRFRNGRSDNDPKTGDVRYDVPVVKLPLGRPPEGYCRNYADASDDLPGVRRHAPAAPDPEQPRAATTWAATSRASTSSSTTSRPSASTPSTSTRSSTRARTTATTRRTTRKVDPYFGTQKDWDNLAKHAVATAGSGSSSTACSTT